LKQAKDLLMAFLDETNMEKAKLYSSFFKAWPEVVGRDAADHSAVRDCKDGVVVIDVDHPGWMQTIYMRKKTILTRLKARFPQLGIVTLRIMHGPPPPGNIPDRGRSATDSGVESGTEPGVKNDTASGTKSDSEIDTDVLAEDLGEIKYPGLYASLSRLADRLKEAEIEDEP
jgi:hypothetical protein